MFVLSLRNRWRDIFSERGVLVPYLLPGASMCQRFHPHASRIDRDDLTLWSAVCPSLDYGFSALCLNLITWSPSSYTPVVPDCPDALSPPCVRITTWQPVKAHGITRNESKIQVIYNTTPLCTWWRPNVWLKLFGQNIIDKTWN